jgi:type II secretory pathway pseudopilin PulG
MLINKTKNLGLKTKNTGQSVIEVIVAVAIFTMIAASAVVTILGSFSTTRLAEEEGVATNLAIEGIEAAQSIRNQNWEFLTDGDHGISKSGTWSFSDISDTVDDRYTRVVNITSIDEDVKEITSSVSWDFLSSRNNTVEIISRLTQWQTAVGQPPVETCNDYCISFNYSSGTCRKNARTCGDNGETYESGGDQYCTEGPTVDTCCCAP